MKLFKSILILFLVLSTFTIHAQRGETIAKKVNAKEELKVNGTTINGISTDSTFTGASHSKLVTEKAIKDYINNNNKTLYNSNDTIQGGKVMPINQGGFVVKPRFEQANGQLVEDTELSMGASSFELNGRASFNSSFPRFKGSSSSSYIRMTLDSSENIGVKLESLTDPLLITTNGLKLSNYGTGTFTGTLTRLIGTDADGDIIEVDPNNLSGSTEISDDVTITGDGSSGSPFKVDSTKISTVYQLSEKEKKADAAVSTNASFYSTNYNGVDSYTEFDQDYTLSSDGDYVQWKSKISALNGFNALGMLGKSGFGNIIGFGSSTAIYIRDINNAWLTTSGQVGNINDGNYHNFKVSWENGVIRIYVDELLTQDNIPQGTVVLRSVGNTYNSSNPFLGEITNIKFQAGSNFREIKCPYFLSDKVVNSFKTQLVDLGVGYISDSIQNEIELSTLAKGYLDEFIIGNEFAYTYFNGTDSKVQFNQNYELDANGDYLEFIARASDFASFASLGITGSKESGGSNVIGFNSSSDFWIRQNNGGWLFFNGISDFRVYRKVKILVNGSNYELYVDDELKGTQAKADKLIINTVGNAYGATFAEFDIKNYKIVSASGNLSVDNFAVEYFLKDNISLKQDSSSTANAATVFGDCYVSYDTDGGFGTNGRFEIYSKFDGHNNKYVRFLLDHLTDSDDLQYYDVWRVTGASVYTFDGSSMVADNLTLLNSGESEFVYSRTGHDDFSGGSTHGDETLIFARFYIDDVQLTTAELSADFQLRKSSNFKLVQKSNMTEAPTGGVFAPGHPLEAVHFKETIFEDGNFKNTSRVIWQKTISDLNIVYRTLVSITQDATDKAYVDDLEERTFTGSSNTNELGIGNWIQYWNPSTGLSARITCTSNIYNDDSNIFVVDNVNYRKFYSDMCKRGTRLLTVNNGDVFLMETITAFDLKQ